MINILCLVLLNTVYFTCNTFPKHIVEISSPLSALAVVFNLIFYMISALFLIVAVNKNKNFFSGDVFPQGEKFLRKIQFKKILLICAVQVLFDIIVFVLSMPLNDAALYIYDVATVLSWIVIYSICATKEQNILRRNKGFIVAIVLVAVTALSFYGNYEILKELSLAMDRYQFGSAQLQGTIDNLDFMFSVKSFVLDTVVGLTLIVSHSLFNRTDKVKEELRASKQIIRSLTLIVLALLAIGAKTLIFPYSCIKGIDTRSSKTKSFSPSDSFAADTETTVITRVGDGFQAQKVFQKTNNKIFYNGIFVLEYVSNDAVSANSYSTNGNEIIIEGPFEKMTAGDVEFSLYKNEVICFLQNGKPTAVYFGNASDNYYAELEDIYKYLAENNNWNFFEMGAEYLLKCDAGFIRPYLERFSSGEFNDEEIRSLGEMCINASYIQEVARELSGR